MYKHLVFTGVLLLAFTGCGGGGNSSGTSSTTPPTLPVEPTPTFSPAAGNYSAAQTVTISDTSSTAVLYYTTDGSTPTTASSLYSKPITISTTTTLNAIAIETGYSNSVMASGVYTITLPVTATPTFSPAAGAYASAQTVAISDATPSSTIYYTTDGSTPTTASTVFSGPIHVTSSETIKAIATATGATQSAVATAAYTITLPVTATPTFLPVAGTYASTQTVAISDATANSTIYYTTDGSTPTTASTQYSGPIQVAADETLTAISTATGATQSAVGTAAYVIQGPAVSVVLSTQDQTNLMAAQPSVNFTVTSTGANKLIVDDTQTYQSIEGFGAAFTDSAADLLENVVPAANLPTTLNDLFTRNGNGIGLSFMRNPMGASDIALSVYSFDDQSVGTTDLPLSSFSIAHDQSYILPLVKAAKALNPQMKLMANPWSPPGWMKDPTSMSPVSMLGGNLLMTSANETAFANYFVDYLKAYQAAGVSVDYISLQNEPLYVTTSYPSMGMSATNQLSLLSGYVLPALTSANLTTKVLVYDHNWDSASYPETVFAGLSAQQLTQVAGAAWHGYGGSAGAQQSVHDLYPSMGQYMTEHSGGTWVANQFTSDFIEITQVLRNEGKAYVKWSLALNEKLGPDLTQNAGFGGCNTCTPIVTVNSTTGAVTKDIEYYTLGHYSKYVLPGAVRVYSSNTPTMASVAFLNPDNSKVLVAYNNSSSSQAFQAQWGIYSLSYTLPAWGAATFTWSGTTTGTATIPATTQIQGSSYNGESGLTTEETSDSTGIYDLGYTTQGSYAVYKNVDFGTGVSGVSVRTASGGNGGTAEFHLDSPTGTLISTVTLPVTGGWQTWQTVTGTVTGASGVHDVYMVINGTTGSISNLNWFQFK
jgi:glucosylceramidase